MEAQGLNAHYSNAPIDAIDVSEAWNLDPFLFCAVKYIQRRGRKKDGSLSDDMAKAVWYIAYSLTKQKWVADKVADQLLLANLKVNKEKESDDAE